MSHGVQEHGVDVELEAQRQHDRTASLSLWRGRGPSGGARRASLAFAG
jgi:hypothetical protein